MALLFPPAAPALRLIAEDLEPMLAMGGGMSAAAVAELHRELIGAAEMARAQEALAGAEEPVSRRLFAIAGAVEKHLGQPTILDPDDVALLHAAVKDCAAAMARLPEPVGSDDAWDAA